MTKKQIAILLLLLSFFTLNGCITEEDDTIDPPSGNTDIPTDPGGTAPTPVINNIRPSAQFTKVTGNENRIQINLLGIIDPVTNQAINFVANQNTFVTEDGILQGIKVTKVSGGGTTLRADICFVVDNSGSMGEEADSVARKIIAFSSFLQASGLDVRVSVVGHGYNSDSKVYGARNFTDATTLSGYLNRRTGLERTVGFSGSDSAQLQSAANLFGNQSQGDENSIIGIKFADSLFTWRSGANRVYVIFTDEPTQPGGNSFWATQDFLSKWSVAKGTIHTVYSSDTTRTWVPLQNERPWDLSKGTGGTTKFIPATAVGLDLTTLPVTGALVNSYLIEFVTSNPTGVHTVVITVKTTTADGKAEFIGIRYQ